MNRIFISICILVTFSINFFNCTKSNSWKGTKTVKDGIIYINNTEKGLWKNSKKIFFKKIISIGVEEGDENYVLASPKEITVDRYGNIYICDFQDHCIKVYDKKGIFIRKIGKKGLGPGELYSPSSISLNSFEEIYVYDSYQRRINIFSVEGEFITSFQTNHIINNITCNSHGDLIISANRYNFFSNSISKLDNNYFIYNKEGKIISSFGKPIILGNDKNLFQISLSYINFHRDKIVSTFQYPYRIGFYNNDCKLTKVITRECDFFSPPELINDLQFYVTRSVLGKPFFLSDGKLLVGVYDQGLNYLDLYIKSDKSTLDDDKEYYDIYDDKGRFLQSFLIESEKLGGLIYIDSEGYVYTHKKIPYPLILKYEIKFRENQFN